MSNINEMRTKGEDFIQLAKEISGHCLEMSSDVCYDGECQFSSSLHGCIFEDIGLGSPCNWEFSEEDES